MEEISIVGIEAALLDGPEKLRHLSWEAGPDERLFVRFDGQPNLIQITVLRASGSATNWFVPTANLACLELTEVGFQVEQDEAPTPTWTQSL